jgi:tetratricopeptide (TPR) repeat protein
VEGRRQVLGSDHPDTQSSRERLHAAYQHSLTTYLEDPDSDPQVMRSVARKATQLLPGHSLTWKYLGIVLYRLHDWQEAADALEKACTLPPEDDGEAMLRLAMARWQLNQPDAAIQALAEGVCRRSGLFRMGNQRVVQREAEQLLGVDDAKSRSLALELVNQQLTANAPYAVLFRRRAALLQAAGQLDASEIDWRRVVDLEPDIDENWAQLVQLQLRQGQHELARFTVQRAISQAIGRSQGVVLAGRQMILDDFLWDTVLGSHAGEDASPLPEWTEHALQLDAARSSPEPLFQHAAWLLFAGRHADYESICAALFAQPITDTRRAYVLCRLATLAEQPVVSLARMTSLATQCAEIDPQPWHLHALGMCHLRAGQLDAAIDRLESALQLEWSAHVCNWLALAIAHQHAGRKEAASEWLAKARAWCVSNEVERVDSVLHPHDRVACRLLLRQAESVADEEPPESD